MTRTAKVGLISNWPAGYDNLRVCWQGAMTGHNCGTCEKCVRTKLNAIASGARFPRTLDTPLERRDILAIKTYGDGQRVLMEEIVTEAAINNVRSPLIEAARTSLKNAAWRLKARHVRRAVKMLLGLDHIHLDRIRRGLRGRTIGAQ